MKSKHLKYILILSCFLLSCSKKDEQLELPISTQTPVPTALPSDTLVPDEDSNEDIDEELPDFFGITTDNLNINAFSHSINNPIESEYGYFCMDAERNIIYYVNPEKGCAIYKIENGNNTLLLDVPVNYIHYLDDELYFILEGGDVNTDGDIYKYNLITDEMILIYEAKAYWMTLTSKGILYSIYLSMTKTERDTYIIDYAFYLLPFNEKEPQVVKQFIEYDDYVIYGDYKEVVKVKKDGEDTPISRFPGYVYWASIYGDNYYYTSISRGELNCINLTDGKKTTYNYKNTGIEPYEFYVFGYIQLNGYTYISNGSCLIQIDTEGTVKKYMVYAGSPGCILIGLFTDGNRIISLFKTDTGNYRMAVLEFEPHPYGLSEDGYEKIVAISKPLE